MGQYNPCDARKGERIPVYRGECCRATRRAISSARANSRFRPRQVFRNIEAALKSAGASWANVVSVSRHTWSIRRISPNSWRFACREIPEDVFRAGKYPPKHAAHGGSPGQGSFPGRSNRRSPRSDQRAAGPLCCRAIGSGEARRHGFTLACEALEPNVQHRRQGENRLLIDPSDQDAVFR